MRIAALILAIALGGSSDKGEQVQHFPSIVYGQILLGPRASKYETIFTITAKKSAPATLDLFNDKGEPMEASFLDPRGDEAGSDTSFRFVLVAGQPLHIKLRITADELKDDVVLRTGWANFHSTEQLDVWALVRIMKPDGTLIDKHFLLPERAPTG
jgi:hypothetical protein